MSESYDELSITMDVPLTASALERDGMLKRMEDAVGWAISDIATGYIMSSDASGERLRVDVEATGLTDPDLLVSIADQLTALLQAPDADGWGPYAIAAEESDDTAATVLEMKDRLRQGAHHVLDRLDPEVRAALGTEAELVSGAVFHACTVIVDSLFEDLQSLHELDDLDDELGASTSDDDEFLVLSELPVRYRPHYGVDFTRQFIVAAVSVSQRFTAGWEPLSCVAEEIAARLILDQAADQLEVAEADVTPTWRTTLEQALFGESAGEWPFSDELATGWTDDDDPDLLDSITAASPTAPEWFTPFDAGRPLPPYLLDGALTEADG